MNTEQQRDEILWKTAKKRASFKWHLISYVTVNAFLVAIWFFTSFQNEQMLYFWPIWPIMGWGLGLFFDYLEAYQGNKFFSAKEEYEKLKKQQGQ
jgi:hypothetical protein